jgi:hypothetical protein
VGQAEAMQRAGSSMGSGSRWWQPRACWAPWETICGVQMRLNTEIIKQNLSLIGKCQQQYKRWSDDN